MTANSKVRNIPLSQLVLSPINVRKTPATAAEDAALEASIRAKGILQNLIVHPTGIDGKGIYEVVAGGRRLKIMQKLAADGAIDADEYTIPCKIEQPEHAVETSLAENTVRANMHPADEFVAMAALIEAGAEIKDVSVRFGTTQRHVKQRLRLGKLAPELLDAYRAGDIDLEAVTAFTLGGDHAAQLSVWNQLKDQSYISPHRVRHLLTETAIALDSGIGMFVGAKAYKAAGGTVTEDLFSSDHERFLDDAALVRQLAIKKLEAKAEELRSEWAWTKAVLEPEYGFLAQYARVEPKPGKLPPELAEERERIEKRLSELEDIPGDNWTAEIAAELEQLEERRAEIDDIAEGLAVYSKKDRKRAGCIVTVGENGGFCLHQGLVERSAAGSGSETERSENWDDDPDADDAGVPARAMAGSMTEGHASAPSVEQAMRKECGYNQLLIDDLKAHRHQITRAHLAGNFEVAFDLALYALCVDLFRGFDFHYHAQPLELRATEAHPRSSLNDLSGTPADRLIEAQGAALDLDWLKRSPAQGFAILATLPPEAKQRLFAWCIASTLKPQLAIEDRADPVLEAAGRRLAIPFADLWRPTTANYWGRAKKAHSLEVGRQILGDRWARDHAGDKKPVLAAALETAFDAEKSTSCIGLDRAARDHAAAWLPPGMAYAGEDIGSPEDPTADAHADGLEAESNGIDPEAAELPAFLTDDEAAELDSAGAV